MFSTLKSAFGIVTARTNRGIITVEGIPTYTLRNDIQKIWGTSRIESYMFNQIGSRFFSFNAFFALDIVYALEKLLSQRYLRTSRRVLLHIIEVLKTQTWLSTIDNEAPKRLQRDRLSGFLKTPMDKQQEFFDAYERVTGCYNLNGMLLAAAAGSGKTITSLMLSEMLNYDTTIVISPINAIHEVWAKTLKTEFYSPPTHWLSTGIAPMTLSERYLIVHYEALPNFVKHLHLLKGKRVNVVLDESHNFNTRDSLRTEMFTSMCALLNAKDVLWMSGTPIKALGSEAIPLFRSIDPLFTPDTEIRFRKIFGISSTRGADILNSRLGIMSYKVEKKDLPIEAPEITTIAVKVPNGHDYTLEAVSAKMAAFTAERSAYYDTRKAKDNKDYYEILEQHRSRLKRKEDIVAYENYRNQLKVVIHYSGDARFCAEEVVAVNRYENKEIIPNLTRPDQVLFKDIRSIVKYVKLKIRGECLGRVVAKERMRAHYDMCSYIEYEPILDSSEKKTIIFTSFVEVLERLLVIMREKGLTPVSAYGKTNTILSATLKRLEEDSSINPMIATYKSLSTAVPLLMCDRCICIDVPFRDYILQQAISRISRIGATTRAEVFLFQLDTGSVPNISTRGFDILKWSQQQTEAIIGIKSPFDLNDDLSNAETALEGIDEELPVSNNKLMPSFMEW